MSKQTRKDILDKAAEAVSTDRNADYGEPEDNFDDIARLWTAWYGQPFLRVDVSVMMILVKLARLQTSPTKLDHWVDIAGYAACGSDSALADKAQR